MRKNFYIMKNKLHTCIISQGDEILQGNIVNSNTKWLSSFFVGSQYHIIEHVTVGDDMKQLIKTFSRCIHEYDVILSMSISPLIIRGESRISEMLGK